MVSVEITRMLQEWSAGDESALHQLIPMVYAELRRTARRHMRKERAGNTLQTTALVNEVYLRLVNVTNVGWRDRAHFFAMAAQIMRRILVDAARARACARRGGQAQRVEHSSAFNLDDIPDVSSSRDGELIAIDDALKALARMDPRTRRARSPRPSPFCPPDREPAPVGPSRNRPHRGKAGGFVFRAGGTDFRSASATVNPGISSPRTSRRSRTWTGLKPRLR